MYQCFLSRQISICNSQLKSFEQKPKKAIKRLRIVVNFSSKWVCCLQVRRKMAANGLGLGEEGELKVQMFNKPQMLIEVQMFNLALLPLFRQTLVMCRFFCQVMSLILN